MLVALIGIAWSWMKDRRTTRVGRSHLGILKRRVSLEAVVVLLCCHFATGESEFVRKEDRGSEA